MMPELVGRTGERHVELAGAIAEGVQKGKAARVKELVAQALASGLSPDRVLDEGLLAGMNEVSLKFRNNELYIPEVLIAARAMNAGMALLQPLLVAPQAAIRGRVVIGTVKGDLHDLGKNLVKLMMEARGLEVIDLGVDVPASRFVQVARERRADIVACSALLTTTMPEMAVVMQALAEARLRGQVRTLLGGAPVTAEDARAMGADAYSPNASGAADAALALL
jgi:5-methyltetrahydrofolate--homocysteine methyltransferase